MPATEHSAEILAGSWPAQSVMSWSGYAMEFSQAANRLFKELDTQADIKDILGPMEGAFIDSARGLAMGRETALQNRIEAYRHISKKAHWAANELHSTKSDLVEIVKQAEENIKTSRENAEKAKAAARANPLAGEPAVAAIESQLQSSIAAIVALAKSNAMARDSQGAATVTALSTDISQWAAPFVNHILPQSGGIPDMGGLPAAPALPAPAPLDGAGSGNVKPVDYVTGNALDPAQAVQEQKDPLANNAQQNPDRTIQQTALRQPDKIDPHQASKPQTSSPSAPSSPSPSSAGSSSNPSSVLGQMMKPASSGSSSSSPASSSSSSPASSGASNPAAASQSGQMANANGANAGAGAGTGANAAANAAGRAPGMASLGSGIADTSAKMASGAVNVTSNAVNTATNVGSNVAQNVAHAAAQAPAAASPAAVTTPASVGGAPVSGGAPMGGMMPAAPAGGAGAVNPVTAGGGAPSAPAATPTSPAASPAGGGGAPQATAAGAAGSSYAPVPVPHSSIRGIGADGATGDVIFDQAMDAGQDVIKALVAQTLGTGYIDIQYAVSLIWERGGTITAWMATSEGASYIPLGVRVPQDVRLSVTDPIIGHELAKTSAEAGGANPLEIVVRQAEAREQAAPGARVLALASSLPMDRVMDWAGVVGARPVSVNPKEVDRATGAGMSMLHRCAVAMPWEWRQANAFSEEDRLRVAARHMHMAANAGHLGGGAAERVIELFEERQPIPEALWADVAKQRFMALIGYQSAMSNAGQGGAEPPARLLASARAAEVVLCLRDYGSVEGCADLLYASRLAGAPLSPAAAVA